MELMIIKKIKINNYINITMTFANLNTTQIYMDYIGILLKITLNQRFHTYFRQFQTFSTTNPVFVKNIKFFAKTYN